MHIMTFAIIQAVYVILTIIAIFTLYRILERRLDKVHADFSQVMNRLDRNLAATVKLLEVRDYYQETSTQLKKMLEEAYKDGNRFRQDQIRSLMARLDTLKARTVDKTVRILDSEAERRTSKRRRRSRRPRRRKTSSSSNKRPSRNSKPSSSNGQRKDK